MNREKRFALAFAQLAKQHITGLSADERIRFLKALVEADSIERWPKFHLNAPAVRVIVEGLNEAEKEPFVAEVRSQIRDLLDAENQDQMERAQSIVQSADPKRSGDAADLLRKHWPWLRTEFQKLDDNLRELSAELSDPMLSGAERETALISSAQLLCRSMRACQERKLFAAAEDDLSELGVGTIETLQAEVRRHLQDILQKEEAVLILAGLNPASARGVIQTMNRLPRSTWESDPLFYQGLDRSVALAIKDVCENFPKTQLEFKAHAFGQYFKGIKKKYGVVGGLTVAAANVVVSIHVPEPITITKFSKLLGVALTHHSAGGS